MEKEKGTPITAAESRHGFSDSPGQQQHRNGARLAGVPGAAMSAPGRRRTGATDDIMSRLATFGDGTSTYAAYKYVGADKIVTEGRATSGA
jgi:hypothetical protein